MYYPEFQSAGLVVSWLWQGRYCSHVWSPRGWSESFFHTHPLTKTNNIFLIILSQYSQKVVFSLNSPISLATVLSLLSHLLIKTISRPLRASWRRNRGRVCGCHTTRRQSQVKLFFNSELEKTKSGVIAVGVSNVKWTETFLALGVYYQQFY